MAANKPKKKQALRNNEYYNTQKLFDELYEKSQRGETFTYLMELIASKQNILLAYRAIKKNKGSKTKGVNSTTILEMGEKQPEELIAYVRKRLQNFHPHAVRRVEIPKSDGRMRPLGIPTIEDRIVQQCIKQVLEPICELQKAISPIILQKLMEHPIQGQSTELNDNRISLYVAQRGKCAVCKELLLLGNMEVHHITPKSSGGKDNYSNLALVTGDVHKLIHAIDPVIIQKYFDKL